MVRARALVSLLPIALATLVLSLLTRPPVKEPDDSITIATVEAWLRGETTLEYESSSAVPTRRIAGAHVYDRGDGLRAVRTPTFAVIAFPFVALGHVFASSPLVLREGEAPSASDPRTVLYGVLAPLTLAIFLALFVGAARALVRSPNATENAEKTGVESRWRRLAIGAATLAVGAPLLVIGPSAAPSLLSATAMMFAICGVVIRETRAGAFGKSAPWAAGLAVAICPEQIFLAVPVAIAFYLNERSWRRSPSRAMARFVVPLVLALALIFVGEVPVSSGGWNPLRVITEMPAGALAILTTAPVLIVTLLGIPSLAHRSSSLAWIAIAIPSVALLMYGGWRAPTEGDLLAVLAPLGLAFACVMERSRAVVVVGAGLSLISVAIAVGTIASRGTWIF